MKLYSLFLVAFLVFIFSGCTYTSGEALRMIDEHAHNQVILVKPINQTQARLSFWQFEHHQWNLKYGPIPAVVGRSGIIHQDRKKEGDGHTPAGMYEMPYAFGDAPTINSMFKYRQATSNDFWVDDPKSPLYNQWVIGKPAATSFEYLKRDDQLYKLAVVIDYNNTPIVPGKGSAIFLHIWRSYYYPTAGCVAINQRHLRKILNKLNNNLKPVILINENTTHSQSTTNRY